MTQPLFDFLKNSKEQLASESTIGNGNVHVVMGNEACDLDSAVCSLCLACHLHYTTTTPFTLYRPILNIKRSEYRLKTEVTYVLLNAGINESLVTFKDEIDLPAFQKDKRLKITLVDFNKINNNLDACVVRVVDHHVNKRTDQVDSTIETVGSCATLVAETIMKDRDGQLSTDVSFMQLLYAAILIDTNCLKNHTQTTKKDISMVKKIEKNFPDLNRQQIFENVAKAKNNISGLNITELMLKDMKVIEMKGDTNKLSISLSSIRLYPRDFFTKESPQKVLESFRSFADDNKHQVLIMMFVASYRYLALYSEKPALLEKTISILTNHNHHSLQLQQIQPDDPELTKLENKSKKDETKKREKSNQSKAKTTKNKNESFRNEGESCFRDVLNDSRLVVFLQGNSSASRKVVLPMVEDNLRLIFELL